MLKMPDTVKMVITDFDGIITDNCVYVDSKGETSRKLNFKDIMGFSLLKKNGYKTAIISGEANSAIELVKEKFQIEDVYQGIRNKIEVLESIITKYNLRDDEFIYVGDDVNDIDSLNRAKWKFTVPNAVEKVRNIANIQITTNNGGAGAFREIVDALID
jgi:YrbI family 3-deoxy-D-manno-octulosonate 8-phosphate phosphatase